MSASQVRNAPPDEERAFHLGAAIGAWIGRPNPERTVLVIIATATILRIIATTLFGLGVDESYMVAAGRELHVSYFDHPPLSWWLAWGAAHLFGSDAPVVVRLPFIALFAASSWLMHRLATMQFSRQAGVWATLAFNIAPVFGFTSASWVLPDGPLITALLGCMICLARATGPDRDRAWLWWLGAGLCGGLALLSKYTAILVLFGAALAVLTHPAQRRCWLRRPEPWLAVAVAAALFSPVIWWNAGHHWCSFAFQGGRAAGSKWHPFEPAIILGGEAVFVLPWIWLQLMTSLVAAWRRGPAHWPEWMLACSGTPPIVLFALVGVWSRGHVLFHWAAPGYLMLFPLLGAALARRAQTDGRALRRIAAASVCLVASGVAIAGSQVRWNWLPLAGDSLASGADPALAAVDWTSIVPQMRARGWLGPGKPVVAAWRWHDAGKMGYALGDRATVICLGADAREFGIAYPAAGYRGGSVLVVYPGTKPAPMSSLRMMFHRIESLPTLTVFHAGRPAMVIQVYLGTDLQTGFR